MSEAKQLILALLRDHPKGLFGLDLVRLSEGKLGRATIYVHLGDLEGDGLIESEAVPEPPLPLPRRRYRLTRKGLRSSDEDPAQMPAPV